MLKLKPFNYSVKTAGFTLVELLIVVTLIGISSGILISIINTQQQRQRANDAVIRTNMAKIVEILDHHRTLQGSYPLVVANAPADLTYFAQGWLDGKPTGADYTYWADGTGSVAGVIVPLSTTRRMKWYSAWNQIRECGPTAVANNNACP
jgi:prepilin-type N-terminal cleavage/methylation domain-containing protein